ncbi:MAG: regulatory protein RecX, regulatory protein [Chloroflexi bacterium CSP1-4]|nr:MAG: regulatory protein RecX, regulatory protein [Chloroflexi bacterium CSP1-4]
MSRPATGAERRARADARKAERAEVQDPAVVLDAAAAFLAVRPRSIDETRRRLRHLGYPPVPVEIVLERLIEFGYLDDEAFARAWVESRDRSRPRGASALRRELALKGVERPVVDAVLDERDHAAEEARGGADDGAATPDGMAADRLLARKAAVLGRETDPRKRRQKAYALLARHGFSPDVIAAALGRAATDDSDLDSSIGPD